MHTFMILGNSNTKIWIKMHTYTLSFPGINVVVEPYGRIPMKETFIRKCNIQLFKDMYKCCI
jgi:hypothetical protein